MRLSRRGELRPAGEPAGERVRVLAQFAGRQNAVDDAPFADRLGRIGPGRQDGFRGPARACPGDEALRSASERRGADYSLDETELGVLGGPDQVAAERDLESGGQAEALHGGDRGPLISANCLIVGMNSSIGSRAAASSRPRNISTSAPAEKFSPSARTRTARAGCLAPPRPRAPGARELQPE
jgi:hypothetical protein